MKELDFNTIGVVEMSTEEVMQTNAGGVFEWFGYAMGILAAGAENTATENPEYVAMTHSFSH